MSDSKTTRTVGGGADGVFELASPTGPCVMRQRWRDLLFLHWEIDPAELSATLPEGLTVDTFRGRAYVGVVPFVMERVRPRGLPPVPGLSWFGELNLRTYVVGPDGRPGVWFYSLDAHQRIAVWLARTIFALPYHHAAIRYERSELAGLGAGRISYHWSRGRGLSKEVKPAFIYDTPPAVEAKPSEPGTLEHFLAERYLLYSRRPLFVPGPGSKEVPAGGKLYVGRVDHEPYRVTEVAVQNEDKSLFGLNGFETPDGPSVSALWSPGVDVSVHPLRRIS
ncbi:MAG: DUF2071 domain-containing protein [Planctomycetota bacterium]